jgi:hypothetical protein
MMTLWRCPGCQVKAQIDADADVRRCPSCGYTYRVRLSADLSSAIDDYAQGRVSADEVVQAGFDQDFREITESED